MNPPDARWEHFHHQADVGVRGLGPTRAAAFEQAALALTAVITDLDRVRPTERVAMACQAEDDDLLLFAWLSELVYEMAVRHMLFSRFQVRLDGTALTAQAWGERIDRDRHQPAVEVKGATLTELAVRQERPDRWLAQCVVDV